MRAKSRIKITLRTAGCYELSLSRFSWIRTTPATTETETTVNEACILRLLL